jgi:hypothetical protein
MFVNTILCFLQNLANTIYGILNDTVGSFLEVEFTPPGLGCVEEEEMM